MNICTLCLTSKSTRQIAGPDNRLYFLCENCNIIQTSTRTNSPGSVNNNKKNLKNKIYVNGLNRLIDLLKPMLSEQMEGLDYNCGKEPTMAVLLKQADFSCDHFDKKFFPYGARDITYDYIFMAIEQCYNPSEEFKALNALLSPGGLLVIHTESYKSVEKFKSWGYARNASCVSFFHDKTFAYVTKKFGYELLDFDTNKIYLLRKLEAAA